MKIKFACLLATLLLFPGLKAQNRRGLYGQQIGGFRTTLTASAGPAYLFGDLGDLDQKKVFLKSLDLKLVDTGILYSLGLRHIFANNMGIKAAAFYGTFKGNDEDLILGGRGYFFESTLYEFAVQGELILLGGPNSNSSIPHTLFVYAGGGVMHSKGNIDRDSISSAINTTAAFLPFGMGYQLQITNNLAFGAEYGYHFFFNDLVDGLHTPYSKFNDILASLSFTVSYKINKGSARGKQIQWW